MSRAHLFPVFALFIGYGSWGQNIRGWNSLDKCSRERQFCFLNRVAKVRIYIREPEERHIFPEKEIHAHHHVYIFSCQSWRVGPYRAIIVFIVGMEKLHASLVVYKERYIAEAKRNTWPFVTAYKASYNETLDDLAVQGRKINIRFFVCIPIQVFIRRLYVPPLIYSIPFTSFCLIYICMYSAVPSFTLSILIFIAIPLIFLSTDRLYTNRYILELIVINLTAA